MTVRMTDFPFTRGTPSMKSIATSAQTAEGTGSGWSRPPGHSPQVLGLVALAHLTAAHKFLDPRSILVDGEVSAQAEESLLDTFMAGAMRLC